MELLLKKYFWVLNSLLLIGGGFVTSRALSSYVRFEVFKSPLVAEADASEAVEDEGEMVFRRPQAMRSVDLKRRQELAAAEAAAKNVEPKEIAKIEEPVLDESPVIEEEKADADIDLELIAVITTTDPAKNLAMVRIDGSDASWVGIGTELKLGFKITKISNYYIEASEGVTELLWKKQEEKGPKLAKGSGPGPRSGPPPRKTPEPRVEKKPAKKTNKYADGIKQTGPFDYRIDRGMLNEQLQDLAKLGREARVIPNYDKESGSYKGFKLIGVRPNSLYRAIGIRSGDVISQINGSELSSPGKALELFTQLQNSSGITLDIMRRGKAHSLNYTIE